MFTPSGTIKHQNGRIPSHKASQKLSIEDFGIRFNSLSFGLAKKRFYGSRSSTKSPNLEILTPNAEIPTSCSMPHHAMPCQSRKTPITEIRTILLAARIATPPDKGLPLPAYRLPLPQGFLTEPTSFPYRSLPQAIVLTALPLPQL